MLGFGSIASAAIADEGLATRAVETALVLYPVAATDQALVLRDPTKLPSATVPRSITAAGSGVAFARRWFGIAAVLVGQIGTAPAATGAPRTTTRGGIPITRQWVGYAKLLKPAIQGPLVAGAPRKTTLGRIPIARPWAGYARTFTPSIRGALVTGSPRDTVRAGPGNGLPIVRWARYGATVTRPAIRGALVTGAPRDTIVGAVAIARARVPFARVFTHPLGGKVTPGQTTTAHGTPIVRRWTGFALVLRPAVRGPLVTGSPRKTIAASIPITTSRVAFSPVARVFEAKTGVVAGTTGAPRSTIRGGIPIVRPWVGFAKINRPAIRGSLVTGPPRHTIAAALPPTRRWVGFAILGRPAIRGPLVTGSPRDFIRAAVPILRGVGSVTQTGPQTGVVTSFSPRRTILGGVPAASLVMARRVAPSGRSIVFRPAIRGALVTGARRSLIRAAIPILRVWPGIARVTRPEAGQGPARHRTIIAGIVPPRAFLWSRAFTQTGGQTGIIFGDRHKLTRAAVPITRPWFGTDQLFRALGGVPTVIGVPPIPYIAIFRSHEKYQATPISASVATEDTTLLAEPRSNLALVAVPSSGPILSLPIDPYAAPSSSEAIIAESHSGPLIPRYPP